MKKEATPKRKGLKRNTSDEKEVISKNQKKWNQQLPEASFAKLMLEGEGDAFRFHQMQLFNFESCEGDLKKLKIRNC
jgi:hypothetical protein